MPKVDERFYGKGYRWGYQVGGVVKRNGMSMNSLVVTDMRTLSEQAYQIRTDQPAAILEATFAPRSPDSLEGDGYIIVHRHGVSEGDRTICRREVPRDDGGALGIGIGLRAAAGHRPELDVAPGARAAVDNGD